MENKILFSNIKNDVKNGLTNVEIIKKYNLKSNYLIKKALGMPTGADAKYSKGKSTISNFLKKIDKKCLIMDNLIRILIKECFEFHPTILNDTEEFYLYLTDKYHLDSDSVYAVKSYIKGLNKKS